MASKAIDAGLVLNILVANQLLNINIKVWDSQLMILGKSMM